MGALMQLIALELYSSGFVILVAVVLFGRLKAIHCRNFYLYAAVEFPGTFLHELAHYSFSLLLGGRPTSFSVLPKTVEDDDGEIYYEVGSVGHIALNAWNRTPVALAPLFLLVPAYRLYQHFFLWVPFNVGTYLIFIYLFVVIVENAIPSSVDFRLAFRQPVVGTLWCVGMAVIVLYALVIH